MLWSIFRVSSGVCTSIVNFQPTVPPCIVERQIVRASAEHLAGGGVLDEAGGAVSTSNHVCP